MLVFIIEFLVSEEGCDGCWYLLRHGVWLIIRLRGEGVGAMIKHALGVVLGVNSSLYAEVTEHGIRFPAS